MVKKVTDMRAFKRARDKKRAEADEREMKECFSDLGLGASVIPDKKWKKWGKKSKEV